MTLVVEGVGVSDIIMIMQFRNNSLLGRAQLVKSGFEPLVVFLEKSAAEISSEGDGEAKLGVG